MAPVVIGLLASVSCIRENLDSCPPEGASVEIVLRAEKFRARVPYGPSDMEESFRSRIHSLDYLLYADGRLTEQGSLGDVLTVVGDSYVFRRDNLPPGTYRAAFVANASPAIMTGKKDAPEQYYILYRGGAGADDHFRGDLQFDVNCQCLNRFETVLKRVYGASRFHFENVPPEVTAIEVALDNVGERMPVCGDPDRACVVTKRLPVGGTKRIASGAYTLGTFCTLPGVRSSWRMKLYGEEAATPIYEQLVTDTLNIECNQLLELKMRFKEGGLKSDIEFSVEVESAWDGSNETGGEIS